MAERYDNDRWRSDNDRPREYRDEARVGADRDRGSYGDRAHADRNWMARGTDEVRSWFGDDDAQRRREFDEIEDRRREYNGAAQRRETGPASSSRSRDWPSRSPEAAWEGGGRINRSSSSSDYPGYYDRGRYIPDHFDRSQWGNFDQLPASRGTRDAARRERPDEDRFRTGYYESSMGYGAAASEGNLNPFPYRGPGSYAGRGPRNYQRSDERIREDVVSRLTDDHRVDASDIDVKVQSGEVTLSGKVQNRRMRRAAEECVEDLAGVRDVHNALQIEESTGTLGHPGSPLEREDVTSLNLTGPQARDKR